MVVYKSMKENNAILIIEFENLKIVAGNSNFFNEDKDERKSSLKRQVDYVHHHVYYEIFMIGDSPVSLLTEKDEKTYVNKILVVPPTLEHNGFSSQGNIYTITAFENGEKKNKWFSSIKRDEVTVLDLTDNAKEYFNRILKSENLSSLDKIKCECLLKLLLTEIFQLLDLKKEQNTQEVLKEKNLYVEQIDQYVNTHYIGNKASLSELASGMFISVRQASRLIKKLYGCTFPQVINRRRMQTASYFLKHSDYSIGKIINLLEFETENYFFYTFKKHFGESPLQFRKKYRNNSNG